VFYCMVSCVYFSHPTLLRRTGVCRVSEGRVCSTVWGRACISHTLHTCAVQPHPTHPCRVLCISHTLHPCAEQPRPTHLCLTPYTPAPCNHDQQSSSVMCHVEIYDCLTPYTLLYGCLTPYTLLYGCLTPCLTPCMTLLCAIYAIHQGTMI